MHLNIIETGMQIGDKASPRNIFVTKPSHRDEWEASRETC